MSNIAPNPVLNADPGPDTDRLDLHQKIRRQQTWIGIMAITTVMCLILSVVLVFIVANTAHSEVREVYGTITDDSTVLLGSAASIKPTIRQTENFLSGCVDTIYRATSADYVEKQKGLSRCFYSGYLSANKSAFYQDFIDTFTSRDLGGEIQPIYIKASVIGSDKTGDADCIKRINSTGSQIGVTGCYKVSLDYKLRYFFYGTNLWDDVNKSATALVDVVSRSIKRNGLTIYQLRESHDVKQ